MNYKTKLPAALHLPDTAPEIYPALHQAPVGASPNAIGAALASMLIHVVVKKESAHVHFKGWSDSFAAAVLTDLHFIEVRVLDTNAELSFVYLNGTVEILGLDYRCFGGESLHDPDVQIAQVFLWDDATEATPELICWQPATFERNFTLNVLHTANTSEPNLAAEVSITSNGSLIVATNFWTSKLAQSGAVAVSLLDGHLRILVPDAIRSWALSVSPSAEWLVAVIPTDKWRPGETCLAFVFSHGDRIHGLNVEPGMLIGPMPAATDGTKVLVSLWVSQNGKPRCAVLRPAMWTAVDHLGGNAS